MYRSVKTILILVKLWERLRVSTEDQKLNYNIYILFGQNQLHKDAQRSPCTFFKLRTVRLKFHIDVVLHTILDLSLAAVK